MLQGIPGIISAKKATIFTQIKTGNTGTVNATSLTVTFDHPTTAGNLLIVVASSTNNLNAPTGFTQQVFLANAPYTYICNKTATGSETSIVIPTSASASSCIMGIIMEIPIYKSFDIADSANIGTGTTTAGLSSGPATTVAKELAVLAWGTIDFPSTQIMAPVTYDHSFNAWVYLTGTDSISGDHCEVGMALKLLTSTGTVVVNATWVATSNNINNLILATFK